MISLRPSRSSVDAGVISKVVMHPSKVTTERTTVSCPVKTAPAAKIRKKIVVILFHKREPGIF